MGANSKLNAGDQPVVHPLAWIAISPAVRTIEHKASVPWRCGKRGRDSGSERQGRRLGGE